MGGERERERDRWKKVDLVHIKSSLVTESIQFVSILAC